MEHIPIYTKMDAEFKNNSSLNKPIPTLFVTKQNNPKMIRCWIKRFRTLGVEYRMPQNNCDQSIRRIAGKMRRQKFHELNFMNEFCQIVQYNKWPQILSTGNWVTCRRYSLHDVQLDVRDYCFTASRIKQIVSCFTHSYRKWTPFEKVFSTLLSSMKRSEQSSLSV